MAKGEDESWFTTKDDMAAKRAYTVDAAFSDGEDSRWFPRGGRRKGESLAADGATNRAKTRPNVRRSQSTLMDQAVVVLCCCGPRWGRKYDNIEENTPEVVLRTKGRWEVDADDEYYKPPVWKQIILKVKAQAKQANCGNNNGDWVNYDSQSYQKNFDNGSDVSRANDANEKLGLKEQAALPDLSPLPVRASLKPKDDFVPIWQRRASSPVTLDVRQRS